MKKVVHISLMILFTIAVMVLMGFIVYEHGRQNIHAIKIHLSGNEDRGFLNEDIIMQKVLSADSIEKRTIRSLDMRQLEELISSNPYVEQVDAYVGINRDLIINVKEREILFRVYLPDNVSFYVDNDGRLLPLCSYYTPRTLVTNGYIHLPEISYNRHVTDSLYANTKLTDLYLLAQEISQNTFLHSLISQIYVNSKGEYDLIPELGRQTIQLGSMENLEAKLRNLEAFYKQKLPKEGWNKYETINLMYKNQIVCKKK